MTLYIRLSLSVLVSISLLSCSGSPSDKTKNASATSPENSPRSKPSSASAEARNLHLTGAPNARDLGGMVTIDGKKLKPGLLIRTDQLGRLTEEDLTKLSAMPVRTVVDFRTEDEIKNSPDKNPASTLNAQKIGILSGNLQVAMKDLVQGKIKADDYMVTMYKSFADDPAIVKKYTNFFKLVQDPKAASIVYHCTAGKDRTGVATALILSALDVSYADIMTDYLASNQHPQKAPAELLQKNPDLKDMLGVKEKYLNATFDAINNKYGNVQNFLTRQLGVDTNKMKELYLEK